MAKLKIDASVNDSKIDALIKKISVLKERIQELRTVMSTMDAKDPSINIPFEEYKEARVQIKEYMEEIRKLKQEQYDQAKAAKDVINQQVEEIRRLTKAYQEAEEKAARGGNTEGRALSEQARTYAEAIDSINRIIGTREENARAIIKELNSLSGLKAEYKKLDEQVKTGNISKEDALRIREKLIIQENEHKQSLSRLNQILKNETKEFLAASTSMDGMSQTLGRMRMVYRSLTEEERNSEFGKNLIVDIQKLDVKLKELDATIGNYQRNVGNYGSSWNGLQNSFQQVVREMPSLAISLNTFFLAISNNLPMLADEIKKANAEYKAFKASIASGNKDVKEVAPVWKQLTKSLLSWQSALVVGISLLSIYGKDIADWVAGLFKAKNALSDTFRTSEEFQKKVGESSVSSIITLEKLSEGWKQLGNDINAQKKYILDNKDAFNSMGQSITNVSDAENLLINNKEAFIQGMLDKAKAAATMDLASQEYTKAIQKMFDAEVAESKGRNWLDKIKSTLINIPLTILPQSEKVTEEEMFQERIKKIKSEAKDYEQNMSNLIKSALGFETEGNKKIIEAGGNIINSLIEGSVEAIEAAISLKQQALKKVTDPKDYKRIEAEIKAEQSKLDAITGKKEKTKYIDSYAQSQEIQKSSQAIKDSIIKSELEIRQQQIDLMKEGSDKQLAQIRLNYDKRYQEIQKEERELLQKLQDEERKQWEKKNPDYQKKNLQFIPTIISLTPEQRKQFDEEYSLAYQKQSWEISQYYEGVLSKYQGYVEKRLAIQKKFQSDRDILSASGASKEKQDELRYQEKEALMSIDKEFAMREDSFKSWADSVTNLSLEQLRELLVKAEQELQRMEFLNPNSPQLAGQRTKILTLIDAINKKSQRIKTSPDKRSNKEWQELYRTLSKVEKEFGEIGDEIGGTMGKIISAAGEITSSTLQMVDGIVTLTDNSAKAISETSEVANTSILSVERASVILTVIGGALKIATKIANLFGGNKEEERRRYLEYLNSINKVYGDIIDKAKGEIVFGGGFSSISEATKAMDVLEKKIQNLKNIVIASPTRGFYSNTFGDLRKEWVDAFKGIEREDLADYAKTWLANTSILTKLTSKELADLKEQNVELWATIPEEQKQALEEIIKAAEEGKSIIESLSEAITGVSFDSFYDGFIDQLANMDNSARDFANNFEEYLRKSILASIVANKYKTDIEKLYNDWVEYGKDQKYSEEEVAKLRELQNTITEGMIAERESLSKVFGWNSGTSTSQDSTKRGFETMSQDTGEELNGRFTALQMAGEEIKNQTIEQTRALNLANATASQILAIHVNVRDIADESRNFIVQSYMELQGIHDDTSAMVKPIKNMANDIAEIKRNTRNL
jgi:hypothetical protein